MGHSVTGVEPDPAARAAAAAAGLTLLPGRAEALPERLPADGFDVVILRHVPDHCTDPARALSNAASLVAPGGRVVVEVPNNACAGATLFGPCWHWSDVPRHANFYTPKSRRAAMSGVGLQVERIEYAAHCRQFQLGWAAAQRAMGAALGDPRGAQFRRHAWLSLRTALARAERKYDSVRATARRVLAPLSLATGMSR
jgi:SAM-dependent methyltransferase